MKLLTTLFIMTFHDPSILQEYQNAQRELYQDTNGDDLAYIKRAANLRLVTIRNANHMVPRDQPEGALKFFTDFFQGQL